MLDLSNCYASSQIPTFDLSNRCGSSQIPMIALYRALWHWVIPQAWADADEGSPVCTEEEAFFLPGGGRGCGAEWRLPTETIDEMRRDFDAKMERESAEVREKLDSSCPTPVKKHIALYVNFSII